VIAETTPRVVALRAVRTLRDGDHKHIDFTVFVIAISLRSDAGPSGRRDP
jgi:hypothetical protein